MLQRRQGAHSEIAATNASFKKVYELMTEFTTNGYPWFQVAGLGYTPLWSTNSR